MDRKRAGDSQRKQTDSDDRGLEAGQTVSDSEDVRRDIWAFF